MCVTLGQVPSIIRGVWNFSKTHLLCSSGHHGASKHKACVKGSKASQDNHHVKAQSRHFIEDNISVNFCHSFIHAEQKHCPVFQLPVSVQSAQYACALN